MTQQALSKIANGLREAIAIAKGEAEPARWRKAEEDCPLCEGVSRCIACGEEPANDADDSHP